VRREEEEREGKEKMRAAVRGTKGKRERENMKSGGREKKKKKERRECAGERGDGVRGGRGKEREKKMIMRNVASCDWLGRDNKIFSSQLSNAT